MWVHRNKDTKKLLFLLLSLPYRQPLFRRSLPKVLSEGENFITNFIYNLEDTGCFTLRVKHLEQSLVRNEVSNFGQRVEE